MPGVNYLLNQQLQLALDEKGNVRSGVKPLTFINLDTFIKFQDLFREKKIKMNNLLNEYTDLTKKGKNYADQLYPFEDYISDKVRNIKFESPMKFLKNIASVIE